MALGLHSTNELMYSSALLFKPRRLQDNVNALATSFGTFHHSNNCYWKPVATPVREHVVMKITVYDTREKLSGNDVSISGLEDRLGSNTHQTRSVLRCAG